tara:strand:- start:209 stop:310 length:102 start_codon:yes stop_codon:yes gene_type:complete
MMKRVIEIAFLTGVYLFMVAVIIVEGFFPGIME